MADSQSEAGASRVVAVLLPLALGQAYSYAVPEGMELAAGDYVDVPLGPRAVTGVVWGTGEAAPEGVRLKRVALRHEMAPMPVLHRRMIDWLASYYLQPPGSVLRLCLRVPEVFSAAPERTAYRSTGVKLEKMTPQRARVLEVLADGPPLTAAELREVTGVGASVVKGLAAQGALEEVSVPALQPFARPDPDAGGFALSAEQQVAAASLRAAARGGFSVTLLDGVTGSGKTEVYFEAMAEALAGEGQVLLLLPEIALTGGFIARVEARFGAEPAAWHSGLSPRARERVWRGVADGSARIVVGARSALFLPWKNLRLIVVDEEHEPAFKQEEGVIYHARDMAVVYGSLGKFPVVLSSATPSLESLVNVERGRYSHVTLASRHGKAELPQISLLDMRSEKLEAGRWLSPAVVAETAAALARGEQALLFLNRRGYAPLTLCRTCGHRLNCPNCAASLVEHRFRRILMCHHCGHQEPVPRFCPSCHAEGQMVPCGPGVERLAEEARERFPEARLAILSSDLLSGRALQETLADVGRGAYDLIIGTQLVAKGHHFPNLTLAAVIDADLALESSDPRAGERTWQLLAQVAGRAGRGERMGRALVQTFLPDHPLMRALAAGDRPAFLAHEKEIRRAAGLPPYGRLAAIILSAGDAASAERGARLLARAAPLEEGIDLLGPAPAPLAVIRGRHRWRFLLKGSREADLQGFIRRWLGELAVPGAVRVEIDIDPYSFL